MQVVLRSLALPLLAAHGVVQHAQLHPVGDICFAPVEPVATRPTLSPEGPARSSSV